MRLVVLWCVRLVTLTFGLSLATLAAAQPYPNRPIRLLIPFPPGGGATVVARLVAQSMSELLGQPVVVENHPGSNGNLAGDVVARAAPDGYTLMIASGSLFSVNPHLYGKMPFKPFVDVVPVAILTSDELLLIENAGLPPKNFPDFIDYARRATPPLLFGSIGNGSEHHLAMELLKEAAGVPMTHVPYHGGAAAALGVMGGEVAAMFGGGSVAPLVQAGKLRALAISGRHRSKLFPDLPTISEFYPAYDLTILQVLTAPAGTPPPVLARLRAEINKAVSQPEFAQKLVAAGSGEPFVTTAEEMTARLRADDERYGKIIKSAGLRVE